LAITGLFSIMVLYFLLEKENLIYFVNKILGVRRQLLIRCLATKFENEARVRLHNREA